MANQRGDTRPAARAARPSWHRELATVALASGIVGSIGIGVSALVDRHREQARTAVRGVQEANTAGSAHLVEQGSAAATALVTQLEAGVGGSVALDHRVRLSEVAGSGSLRRVDLLSACRGTITPANCRVTVLLFPPESPVAVASDGQAIDLRGNFTVARAQDGPTAFGYLLQPAG